MVHGSIGALATFRDQRVALTGVVEIGLTGIFIMPVQNIIDKWCY
jgi:hypothetical protein